MSTNNFPIVIDIPMSLESRNDVTNHAAYMFPRATVSNVVFYQDGRQEPEVLGAVKMEDGKTRTGICRTNISENSGPENARPEYGGPF